MLTFSQEVLCPQALVLVSMESLRAVFGVKLTARELERELIKHLLDLSFADQLSDEGNTFSHTSVVFAFPRQQDTSRPKLKVFRDLVFFGKSATCLELAFANSLYAESLLVVGTRSRGQVKRMAQHYFRRLNSELGSAQKCSICE